MLTADTRGASRGFVEEYATAITATTAAAATASRGAARRRERGQV